MIMVKRLDDLTEVKLGKLFPIILSEPDPEWPRLFHHEESRIRNALGETNVIRIEHIRSTAVPNLKARPIMCMSVIPGIGMSCISGTT